MFASSSGTTLSKLPRLLLDDGRDEDGADEDGVDDGVGVGVDDVTETEGRCDGDGAADGAAAAGASAGVAGAAAAGEAWAADASSALVTCSAFSLFASPASSALALSLFVASPSFTLSSSTIFGGRGTVSFPKKA